MNDIFDHVCRILITSSRVCYFSPRLYINVNLPLFLFCHFYLFFYEAVTALVPTAEGNGEHVRIATAPTGDEGAQVTCIPFMTAVCQLVRSFLAGSFAAQSWID